jgi:hypothetical protein
MGSHPLKTRALGTRAFWSVTAGASGLTPFYVPQVVVGMMGPTPLVLVARVLGLALHVHILEASLLAAVHAVCR